MPLMPILVFVAVSVARAYTSRAFLISSTDTAETEHFSLQMHLIFLTLLLYGYNIHIHVSNREQCSEKLGPRVPGGS